MMPRAVLSVDRTLATCVTRRVLSTEASLKHVPFGAAGSGFYSDATRGCFDVVENMGLQVKQSLEEVLDRREGRGLQNSNFRLLDLGTADAGTSLRLVLDVVSAVREREPEAPIEIVYEDQPGNDWHSVFNRTQGTIATEGIGDATALPGDLDDVHVLASGTSYYSTCVAGDSVDMAFCATAMHWLTAAPQLIPDALHSACTANDDVARAFQAQAAQDWLKILQCREKELKEGGALVVANFAVDAEGQFLGRSDRVGECMHSSFADIWAGLVEPAEFLNTNFPNQYRSLADCVAPFENGDDLGSLRLVSANTDVVPCPFLDAFKAGGLSAEEHAARFVPTTRTWSNSTFVAGLGEGRSAAEKDALVQELFEVYEGRVTQDPANHAMDYVHSYLRMVKA